MHDYAVFVPSVQTVSVAYDGLFIRSDVSLILFG